jgi:hypothetical protein
MNRKKFRRKNQSSSPFAGASKQNPENTMEAKSAEARR